ncbi:UNVERIFIED_CONTAM: hypothetical protein GTU68_013270 [Idotea baltica]|nr:hypothetical protein [Idotea baltica]
MKRQFVGPYEFGGEKLKFDELEWMLSSTTAFETDLESDPRGPRPKDVLMASLGKKDDSDSDENDW